MFEYPIVMNIYGTENESMAGGSNLKMDKLDTMMTSLTFVCISPSDNLVAACDGNGITRVVSTENQYLYRLQVKRVVFSSVAPLVNHPLEMSEKQGHSKGLSNPKLLLLLTC